MMMPVMDGDCFLGELKSCPETASVPVMVVTARTLTTGERTKLQGKAETVIENDAGRWIETVRIMGNVIGHMADTGHIVRESNGVKNVLVVEDNEMNRDMLCRRLERKGYSVLVAADGIEGLDLAKAKGPDVIVMDLSLPRIDGWEACRRLKADPSTNAIPIIALTAHAMSTDKERALEAGCDDFDTKPVDFARLVEKIERACTV